MMTVKEAASLGGGHLNTDMDMTDGPGTGRWNLPQHVKSVTYRGLDGCDRVAEGSREYLLGVLTAAGYALTSES